VELLSDSYGRVHTNLRVSVTDRCNIRCFYCMPEDPVAFLPRSEVLTFDEIERFVRAVLPLGIRKVRLTGGEPLVRRGVDELVARLTALPGLANVALTTNGILLPQWADRLYRAGLRRINVHLDTLDPEKFKYITKSDRLVDVLAGIRRCQELGYTSIKINAVAIRGLTEEDLVPLAEFGRENNLVVRFIEFMPLDSGNRWERDRVLFAAEILDRLQEAILPLVPAPESDPSSPAREFVFADGKGRIGIIASISQPFCYSCNRIRLTADGKLRYCLFALEEFDVKELLRGGATDEEIRQRVRDVVARKWEGHEVNTSRFIKPPRPMYAIGG
jgi:cyclic pyranopterin phosphate synthase